MTSFLASLVVPPTPLEATPRAVPPTTSIPGGGWTEGGYVNGANWPQGGS